MAAQGNRKEDVPAAVRAATSSCTDGVTVAEAPASGSPPSTSSTQQQQETGKLLAALEAELRCQGCLKDAGRLLCAGCGARAYCGKVCQVSDWRYGHKSKCRMLQKANSAMDELFELKRPPLSKAEVSSIKHAYRTYTETPPARTHRAFFKCLVLLRRYVNATAREPDAQAVLYLRAVNSMSEALDKWMDQHPERFSQTTAGPSSARERVGEGEALRAAIKELYMSGFTSTQLLKVAQDPSVSSDLFDDLRPVLTPTLRTATVGPTGEGGDGLGADLGTAWIDLMTLFSKDKWAEVLALSTKHLPALRARDAKRGSAELAALLFLAGHSYSRTGQLDKGVPLLHESLRMLEKDDLDPSFSIKRQLPETTTTTGARISGGSRRSMSAMSPNFIRFHCLASLVLACRDARKLDEAGLLLDRADKLIDGWDDPLQSDVYRTHIMKDRAYVATQKSQYREAVQWATRCERLSRTLLDSEEVKSNGVFWMTVEQGYRDAMDIKATALALEGTCDRAEQQAQGNDEKGNLEAILASCDRAIELKVRAAGPTSLGVARLYTEKAQVLNNNGKIEEAILLMDHAIQLLRSDPPSTESESENVVPAGLGVDIRSVLGAQACFNVMKLVKHAGVVLEEGKMLQYMQWCEEFANKGSRYSWQQAMAETRRRLAASSARLRRPASTRSSSVGPGKGMGGTASSKKDGKQQAEQDESEEDLAARTEGRAMKDAAAGQQQQQQGGANTAAKEKCFLCNRQRNSDGSEDGNGEESWATITNCGHKYHAICIETWGDVVANTTVACPCPYCYAAVLCGWGGKSSTGRRVTVREFDFGTDHLNQSLRGPEFMQELDEIMESFS